MRARSHSFLAAVALRSAEPAQKQTSRKPSAKSPAGKLPAKKARTRRDGFTAVRKQKFLGALGRTGVVRDACKIAGISSTTVYRHAKKDADFAAAMTEAHASALPTLNAAAFERAVEGVDEPIVHGGKIVGTRKKYSDPLLKEILGRAADAAARLGLDDKDVLTRKEWEDGWEFGDEGKVRIDEVYNQARAELEATLDEMRERLDAQPPCPASGR